MRMKIGFLRVAALISVAAFTLLTGCTSDKAVISQAADFHTTLQPAVMEDPQLAGYLQQVGGRIVEAARKYNARNPAQDEESRDWMFTKNMKFHFVNSKTLNAFTTGGEHMYIYNELFQQAKSEDELAAVMAHEFAHVYSRHVQSGMNRQYAILGAAAAAGGAGYLVAGDSGLQYGGSGILLAGQFVGMSYTRDDEAEADKRGYDFYLRAGWDPAKFGDFFKHMIDLGLDTGSEYLSDHPTLKSRYANAQKWAASVPAWALKARKAPVADAAAFKALQQRAVAIGKNTPTDESLANASQILDALPRSCLTPTIREDQKKAEQAVLLKVERAKKAQQGQQK